MQEVVEAEDAEAAGPLEQHVQQVARGESVIEGTVGGAMAEAQARRQRSQPAVGHLVADEPAGERAGVDELVAQPGPTGTRQRGVEEADVVPDVVAHEDGVAEELEEARQHLVDARGRHHHRLGDAGEHGDLGRDRHARIDQGLERAQALAAAKFDRPHLGDGPVEGRPPGGLYVDDAERRLAERHPQVFERPLHAHEA